MYKTVVIALLAIIVQRLYFIYSNMITLPSMVDKNPVDYGLDKAVFVTDAVNLDDIDKCLLDRYKRFRHVKSTEFDATALFRPNMNDQTFFVFECDHFVMYNTGSGSSTKFCYRSRNKVLSLLWRDIYLIKTLEEHGFVKDKDGVWDMEQAPVHYFVYTTDERRAFTVEEPNAELLRPAVNLADDNTIVSYYDSGKNEPFKKFSTEVISKGAERCNQEFFVVNNKDLCHVVSAKDPQVSYSFSAKERYKYIPKLVDGSMTVEELATSGMEEGEDTGEFQLRNYDGQVLAEDHLFALQILDIESDGKFYDFGEDWDAGDFNRFTAPYDWLSIEGYSSDQFSEISSSTTGPEYAGYLKLKYVDGILYLVTINGNRYVGIGYDTDYHEFAISAYKNVPPKENRLRINVSEDGQYVTFSMWYERNKVAQLEWLKACCGWVYIDDPNGENRRSGGILQMRVVRME